VLLQFVAARLPSAEAVNYQLGRLFRPGVHSPGTLRRRVPLYLATLRKVQGVRPIAGATVFELGTGWCPIAPVLMHVGGAARIVTVDKVPHLRFALAQAGVAACLLEVDRIAEAFGLAPGEVRTKLERLAAAPDLARMLAAAGIEYRSPADARSTGLPAGSIDIWYSYSVLENIPVPIVEGILAEAVRILAPTGAWFSVIGCKDPFTAGEPGMSWVNYLKYSDRTWAFWTHNQLAYNNRMRESDYVARIGQQGLEILQVEGARAPGDLEAVRTMTLDPRFAGYTPEDLSVYRTEITARPRKPSA
jgi:hypothetical protein